MSCGAARVKSNGLSLSVGRMTGRPPRSRSPARCAGRRGALQRHGSRAPPGATWLRPAAAVPAAALLADHVRESAGDG